MNTYYINVPDTAQLLVELNSDTGAFVTHNAIHAVSVAVIQPSVLTV